VTKSRRKQEGKAKRKRKRGVPGGKREPQAGVEAKLSSLWSGQAYASWEKIRKGREALDQGLPDGEGEGHRMIKMTKGRSVGQSEGCATGHNNLSWWSRAE